MGFIDFMTDYIKSGETNTRRLGLEIEHFVIDENGDQIGFEEVSELIDHIGNTIGARIIYMDGYPVGYYTGEYSISLEPACQFEISINPYSDLNEIKRVYGDFRTLWDPIFEERGYRMVTKGNLPKVELGVITPDEIPLSHKKRYKYMNDYFESSGRYGKYMMRASASAQISVDYRSQEDMVRKLRVLQKIAPILMILMESKSKPDSTLPGVNDRPHLLRIQEWDDLDSQRTGFVPSSFDDDFGYRKMAEVIYHMPLILLTADGETTSVGSRSAADLVEQGIVNEGILTDEEKTALAEHFMSMAFFHFRIKKYIEIRVADSVPIEKALGYTALIKGLIYSDSNLKALENELSGIKTAEEIQKNICEIERYGFKAEIYEGRTAGQWADHLIDLAEGALSKDDKEYLDNVRAVWDICK